MKIYVNEYDAPSLEKAESLLFNGNGYLGVRGNLEEAYYDHFATNRESYLNGFYETKEIRYPEKFIGFTEQGEEMLGIIDGQTTLIYIGGEQFRIDTGKIIHYQRYLDMEAGQIVREMAWTSPKGNQTKITIRRLASFAHKNIFAMQYCFDKLNHNEEIELVTHINFHPIRTIDESDPRMSHKQLKIAVTSISDDTIYFRAPKSGKKASFRWNISEKVNNTHREEERFIITTKLSSTTFEKIYSYAFEEQDHKGLELDFDAHASLQKDYLFKFWETAKIHIKESKGSNLNLEEAANYGVYALLSSIGQGGKCSISAKGLSGSGYEGHYFWDAEIYIFPALLHLQPDLARGILDFRINTLDKARENAKLLGYQRGALYPWRTISGAECSPYFEGGAAQHHINADIAHALVQYYQCTKDLDIFFEGGFALLLETSRLFMDICYEKDGRFHIDGVTGPDEYTAIVNDNYYTNVMVKHGFIWTHKIADILHKNNPEKWGELVYKLGISNEELNAMKNIAEKIEKPFCPQKNIVMQDRDFLNKALWPFGYEKSPLLLHYHPLLIYRYQVSKQADAVLALCLLPDEESADVAKNTVEYYDKVTTHDSSLSYSTFSTVYSRIGNSKKAFEYFLKNARCDLDNLHKNTKDGLHNAAIGGTMSNILYGFCGLRFDEDGFSLNPCLPKQIESIEFSIYYDGKVHRLSAQA